MKEQGNGFLEVERDSRSLNQKWKTKYLTEGHEDSFHNMANSKWKKSLVMEILDKDGRSLINEEENVNEIVGSFKQWYTRRGPSLCMRGLNRRPIPQV